VELTSRESRTPASCRCGAYFLRISAVELPMRDCPNAVEPAGAEEAFMDESASDISVSLPPPTWAGAPGGAWSARDVRDIGFRLSKFRRRARMSWVDAVNAGRAPDWISPALCGALWEASEAAAPGPSLAE